MSLLGCPCVVVPAWLSLCSNRDSMLGDCRPMWAYCTRFLSLSPVSHSLHTRRQSTWSKWHWVQERHESLAARFLGFSLPWYYPIGICNGCQCYCAVLLFPRSHPNTLTGKTPAIWFLPSPQNSTKVLHRWLECYENVTGQGVLKYVCHVVLRVQLWVDSHMWFWWSRRVLRGKKKGIACSSDLCVRYRCLSSYTHLCVCLHWLCKLILCKLTLCSRKCKLCGALRIFSRADFCGKISRGRRYNGSTC